MKLNYMWRIIFLAAVASSCQKNQQDLPVQHLTLIDSSRNYFESEVLTSQTHNRSVAENGSLRSSRKELLKSAAWDKAYTIRISTGNAVVVPINYDKKFIIKSSFSGNNIYSLDKLSKLLIYKDKNGFHAEVVTYFPDSNFAKHKGKLFSGIATVEDWFGKLLKQYKYDGKDGILKLDNARLQGREDGRILPQINQSVIEVCYEVSGYNYSPSIDEYSYWSYFAGCSYMYVQDMQNDGGGTGGGDYGGGDGGGYSGGGGGYNPGNGIAPEKTFTIVSGPEAIHNINEYTKCFTNTPGNSHSYSISLCVDQPVEGSRENWVLESGGSSTNYNPVSAGHVFLIFNETTPGGTITRNVGFYPSGEVTPASAESQGQLNNDANHDFNIALNISVTSSEFTQVLNFITQGNNPGYMYNLNSNNCTTFAVNALGNAGINLPRTNGSWLNGRGLNPGDLGEDIRSMALPSNMTRNTTQGTHQNTGTCY